MSFDYVIDDLVTKKELTDDEEIELLRRAIIEGFDGKEWKYYQPHYKKIFEEYKEYKNQMKQLESKIQNTDLKDMDFGLGKGLLPVNFDKYAEWVVEVPKLKDRIKKLELEIKKHVEIQEELLDKFEEIRKENQRLKIISGEAKSGWIKELDWIYRHDPGTSKPIGYRCPFDFIHEDVKKLKIYFNKYEGEKWVDFEHPYLGYDLKSFDMPHTAYLWLKGELPEQKKESKETDIHDLHDEESLTKYILSKGGSLRGKYPIKVIRFLLKTHGKEFGIHEFDKYCGFQDNRESRRQYKNKLIDWGLIKQTKNQRTYQNLI